MSEVKKPLTVAWIDTETCGLNSVDSAPFEIGVLMYRGSELLEERLFHLNPLDDEVLFHEEAFKVHGVSEETIRSYPPAKEVMPKFAEFLNQYIPEEKLVFAGYNCNFDYGHISGLMFRYGLQMNDFFNGKVIDVYSLVQKASEMGLLPKTENQKLGTMTKALGIPHEDKHSALGDIRSTRRLYELIYQIERREKL